MKSNNIEQVVTHTGVWSAAGLLQTSKQIKCATPMTFSQKLYEYNALEIAQEYEQAIEENSLEKIKILLNKLVKLSS